MESPWTSPLTNLQSAWGRSPPEGGWGNASDPQAQQHGSAERHDPSLQQPDLHNGSGGNSSAPTFTVNLRSVGIDSLVKLDLSTRDAAVDSLDGAARQLRRLGLLQVCQLGVRHGIPALSKEADQSAADMLFEMYKHDKSISTAVRAVAPAGDSGHAVYEFLLSYTSEDQEIE